MNRDQQNRSWFRMPDWSLRTWIGVGLLTCVLITGAAFWGWWNSWSIPEWTTTRYEYVNSPTVFEEVRDIGQLVGAEYYGEVIHSWLEVQEKKDWRRLSDLYLEVKNMYSRHYRAANNLPIRREERNIRQDAYNRFALRSGTLSEAGWYRRVFLKLGIAEAQLLEEIRTTDWLEFAQTYAREMKRARREYRQEILDDPVLIYLGRGDVLLGYDLKTLDSSRLEWTGDTLLILGLNPTVISASINPWYLPPDQDSAGRGIRGFEMLRESGAVTASMTDRVKKGCKEELIRQAYQNSAADLAEQSAERTLLQFFNLLLKPEEQLSVVDIRPKPRYLDIRRWSADGFINAEELAVIKQEVAADSLSAEWLPVLKTLVEPWGQTPGWEFVK